MNVKPIGIFDSGVGGLTVARAVADVLPNEEIYYVGDTAHTPYGDRPLAQVRDLALRIMDSLVERGVKMLVIACNTASSAAKADARERYQVGMGIPVIEVVAPAAQQALATTKNHRIGVIGTRATIASGAYQDALGLVPQTRLYTAACPRFVSFAEQGRTHGAAVLAAAHQYLDPLRGHDIDTLVLGCTHYPLLAGTISYVMGPDVTLVSSADATAKRVFATLVERSATRPARMGPPRHHFATTGPAQNFMALARRIMGAAAVQEEAVGAQPVGQGARP